jgi:hypothetical protein
MKLSRFKLGLGLVIIGMVWCSFIFAESEKTSDSIILKQSNSFELKSEFMGEDIGFYKLFMPEFSGEEIFVQILDSQGNVIQEEKIQTKMSVGYFDFEDGTFTIKVTNISETPVDLQVEFGDTNSHEMIPAGILVLVGAISMIIISYFKIQNYKIEHPEENIS